MQSPLRKATTRQTLSYLRDLFERHGIRPKNKLGQSFLIDLNVLDLLVAAAEVSRNDLVVEIGSGTGSLTERLSAEAGQVLGVEIDPAFFSLASELLAQRENVLLVHADVLKNKNQFNPEVLSALDGTIRRFPHLRLKLVANLPYVVATPVIANFLLSEYPFERFVATVQLEIAERLLASPGNKKFGALSVLVQSLADVSLVRRLPPSVFWPRPKVRSAIVRIDPNSRKRAAAGDVDRLRRFLRDLYAHRRKNLRGALSGLPSGRIPKKEVDGQLARLGLDGAARAEVLSVADHHRLCDVFGK